MCVRAGDDGAGFTAFAIGHGDVHIEFFVHIGGQRNCDAPLGDIGFAGRHTRGRDLTEHFQTEFGTADEHAERNGDGQSHHVGAGNADAHGIFEDIGTETRTHRHGRTDGELFGGAGGGERHTHGFGATDGGHDLRTHEGGDFSAKFFRKHGIGDGIGAACNPTRG